MTEQPTVWIVHEIASGRLDAAFADGPTAQAYAEAQNWFAVEVPWFGPGQQPELVETYEATAEVPSMEGRPSSPPNLTVSRQRETDLTLPVEVVRIDTYAGTFRIFVNGLDRDAVLHECERRYNGALIAMRSAATQ